MTEKIEAARFVRADAARVRRAASECDRTRSAKLIAIAKEMERKAKRLERSSRAAASSQPTPLGLPLFVLRLRHLL